MIRAHTGDKTRDLHPSRALYTLPMLRELFGGCYGRLAQVYLLRGTKQGDILSPLLFNLVFNSPLIGQRHCYASREWGLGQ